MSYNVCYATLSFPYIFIRVEEFNTKELAARGNFRAGSVIKLFYSESSKTKR